MFWKAGVYDLLPSPSASCDTLASGFKKNGRWSEYPAKGAVAFYGYSHDLNHTGIVVDYDDTYIYVVEGNTNDTGSREGNGVYLKKRERRGANVIGYGYPKFSEGIESADPKYKKATKPKETKPKGKDTKPAPAKGKPTVSLAYAVKGARVANWARILHSKEIRDDVAIVQKALKAAGHTRYAQWQRDQGVPANGVPDRKSLTALGDKHGFKVTD